MDSHMDPADCLTQLQMVEAFQTLLPHIDKTLKLAPNPKDSKRPRKTGPNEQGLVHGQTEGAGQPVMQILQLLAKLAIRQDQELSTLRRSDQFILFLSRDQKGAFQHLLDSTTKWKQQMEQKAAHLLPLRQFLVVELLKELHARAGPLVECQPSDALFQTALEKGMILQDRSFPFHKWDAASQKLILDQRTPISAKKMSQHLEELIEMCRDPQLILRFHALKPHTNQALQIIPWRLQLNLRSDRPYELFYQLTHNAIWMIMGASMKPHTQGQTGLAMALEKLVFPPQKAMKGAGKGKSKSAPK